MGWGRVRLFCIKKRKCFDLQEPQLSLTWLCPFSSLCEAHPSLQWPFACCPSRLTGAVLKEWNRSPNSQVGHIGSGYAMVLCRLGGTSFSICWWQGRFSGLGTFVGAVWKEIETHLVGTWEPVFAMFRTLFLEASYQRGCILCFSFLAA